MVYPIFKRTVLPTARLFLKEVKGIENIPKNGPFIITGNHESYLDPFFIGSIIIPLLNKKMHFLAVKGRFWDLLGETIAKKWGGCVCLDEGKEKAFQELLSFLKQEEIVGIFTSSKSLDGKLKKGKTGAVNLALKAHVPLLPIGLIGAFDIAPGDTIIPRLKRAKMHIGKPIYLNKYYKKSINENILRKLTDDLMNVISELTGKPYEY